MKILDHGFVRIVEAWGGGDHQFTPEALAKAKKDYEAGIIEAARQSTQGSFRGWEKDAHLLNYLYTNKHATPFEFAGMVLEIKCPMFVVREWQRHRTQSYNEMSARYAPLPNENYMPTVERLMMGNDKNKQAGTIKGSEPLTDKQAHVFQDTLQAQYDRFEHNYQAALQAGVPKELARCGMPVGRYTQMRASANLRNWLAFLTLRQAPEAQWEIRQYANAVADIVQEVFPQTHKLYLENK